MSKHLIEKEKNSIISTDGTEIRPFFPNVFSLPFIRFSFSQTRISSDGTSTHIEAEEHRFEDGHLYSKQFEGTLAGDFLTPLTQMIEQHMMFMTQAMNLFFPFQHGFLQPPDGRTKDRP